MIRFRAAAALALVAFVAPVLPVSTASPFTSAFFSLQNEMVNRRDGEYAGTTLDAAQKRELKAILKALKTLEREADDIGDDIKTAGKVAKTLEKAFPGEFSPAVAPTLGALTTNALTLLHAFVNNDLTALQDRQGGLVDGKIIAGVQKSIDAAVKGFDLYAAAPTRSASTKGLYAAWKAIQKGNLIADRDQGGGGGGPSLTASIEGVTFTSTQPSAEIQAAGDGLQVFGSDGAFPAAHKSIYILALGVTGTGSFNILSPGSEGNLQEYAISNNTPVIYPFTSGLLTVTVYDPPNRVAGTFFFQATAPAARSIINGSFDITDITNN